MCEQLKGGYGIGEMFKKGVTREGGTEGFPNVPHGVASLLPFCGDASGCSLLDNAEFSLQQRLEDGVTRVHEG
jgi:hypothetical protein